MKRLSILAFVLLSACLPDPPQAPDVPDPYVPAVMSAEERASCEAEGGRVGIAGILGGEFCVRRAPDAGQVCTRAQDCTGLCMAETRTCQEYLSPYGCNSFLDENGEVQTICAD